MCEPKLRIVLCGSSSVATQIAEIASQLHELGYKTVLPTNVNPKGRVVKQTKLGSFLSYFEEIKKSDAVLVVNAKKESTDGYIGPHTLIEMAYAEALRSPIFLMYPVPQGLEWSDEISALKATVLNGNLHAIAQHLSRPTRIQRLSQNHKEFEIERLKFILQQIDALNKATANQWQLYQAVVSAILGATAIVFATWKTYKLDVEAARIAIHILTWLLVSHGLFTVATLVASVRSWFDLRIEEMQCFAKAMDFQYRDPPKWGNFLRWTETWLIAFVVIVTLALSLFAWLSIIPMIR